MSKIIVLGEYFIDRYFIGTADRLSPEAPIPVVKIEETIDKPGGAGNVVANLRSLGVETDHIIPGGPNPIKNRLISNGHQLARWDQHDYVERYSLETLRISRDLFEQAEGLIISDYNKGAFGPAVIELIGELSCGKQIYIDTKRSPVAYKAIEAQSTFFPNLKEYYQFADYVNCTRVVRKEGAQGATYFLNGVPICHVNSYSVNPISVSGAGDTVIAAYTNAGLKGYSLERSLDFSMKAAAIAIGKPLTSVATEDEIKKFTN